MKTRAISSKPAVPGPAVGRLPDPAAETGSSAALSHRLAFLDPEQRKAMIAEAAYYRAEHRGFVSGFELDDWLAAESEVDSALAHDSLLSV